MPDPDNLAIIGCGDENAVNYNPDANCIDNNTCSYTAYCDNPCYEEYDPEPATESVPDESACINALSCADNPPEDCIRSESCDDGDPCTTFDFTRYIRATDEACEVCEGESIVSAPNTGLTTRYSCVGEIMPIVIVTSQNEVNWFDEIPTLNSEPIYALIIRQLLRIG